MTPVTIIWFVGAAIVGAIAGGLHVLRSAIGGSHTEMPLMISAFALTALAAAMLFHGVMLAARAQDAAAGPAPEIDVAEADAEDAAEVPDREVASEGPAAYTFRGGEPVGERAARRARRDRSAQG
ncbi:hypothetical protein [Terrabacter sp. 2YAF2]|uniref:hypothetical protein n=1 Tax=Terrabacter sp. 2YAF2 TaxID=3233026 RepID=UPI003F9BD4F0